MKHAFAEAHKQFFLCISWSVIVVIVPIDFRGKKKLGLTDTSCSITGIKNEPVLVILTGVQNGLTLKNPEGFILTSIF